MAWRNWKGLFGFALLCMVTATSQGNELANTSELAEMQARMAMLERQMATGDYAANDACLVPSCCDCGWYVGAGAYVLAPRWTTNPAFQRAQSVGGVVTSSQTDFDYGLSAAPLGWVGYRGESCLGFEVRGWWFDDSEVIDFTNPSGTLAFNSAAPLGLRNTSTTAGDVLRYASSLEMDVFDLVGTYQAEFGMGTLDFGAGVRYARVQQRYFTSEDPAANNLLDIIDSSHSFEGVGPTLALRGRAPVTRRLTALADLRYSVLFGEFNHQATSVVDNVLVATRSNSSDDFLNIVELELGAEYVMPWRCAEFFLDGAFVAQVWQGVGNAANNDSIVVLVDPEVSDKNANMALLGFRVGGGVRF